MKTRNDNPGVYVPPPLFYVAIFFISILLQRYFPLPISFFDGNIHTYLSVLFFVVGLLVVLPALITFFKTKNTLITFKAASSLQTKGVYQLSRNPMYLGLLFLYIGFAMLKGNWWTFILIPLVIFVLSRFVIANEEQYLENAFGNEYLNYKTKVRRWL